MTSSPADKLFEAAFDDRVKADETIAILSHEFDNRMLVQQSTYTLHGNRDDLLKSTELKQVLKTFNIPAASKQNILGELASFGIRRRTLFPDLVNLSDDLKGLVFKESSLPTTS